MLTIKIFVSAIVLIFAALTGPVTIQNSQIKNCVRVKKITKATHLSCVTLCSAVLTLCIIAAPKIVILRPR